MKEKEYFFLSVQKKKEYFFLTQKSILWFIRQSIRHYQIYLSLSMTFSLCKSKNICHYLWHSVYVSPKIPVTICDIQFMWVRISYSTKYYISVSVLEFRVKYVCFLCQIYVTFFLTTNIYVTLSNKTNQSAKKK